MVLPASDIVISSPKYSSQKVVKMYNEQDILTTGEDFHELQFLPAEEPKMLMRKESALKEKQIGVDPISLREPSSREASFNFMLPRIATGADPPLVLCPLSPAKSSQQQLVSCSLPSSACSSPRFSFSLLKKKWKNESQASPRQIDNLACRHSSAHSFVPLHQLIHLQRSKSCAEGRSSAPADELDLWFCKPTAYPRTDDNRQHYSGVFGKAEEAANRAEHKAAVENTDYYNDEGFKCGALCMYLPGFAKAKPVRARKEEQVVTVDIGNVISRSVSLEKFECGSWASSAIVNDHEDGESMMNLYFDLPLELIRTTTNDATSPVNAAFLFDKERKGVLKNSSARPSSAAPRKSHESSRHVRFSTSSPASPASCITPRLRKAREDFNAFLEAQSA
ncbi:hypothetical protein Tsubulata_027375 [Turnera subulata]|uniref:Uncharacterized protein n=1 Tax=Turnera subulata TaxID=218843 RepID=A0A9Q0JGP5_9ROSI|nr:hypothetical protein Tsubulata_027375 [Turnera subulata]